MSEVGLVLLLHGYRNLLCMSLAFNSAAGNLDAVFPPARSECEKWLSVAADLPIRSHWNGGDSRRVYCFLVLWLKWRAAAEDVYEDGRTHTQTLIHTHAH